MTKIVTIPALELPARIKAIHAGGGTITRMAVERGNYSLTVRWNEQPELVSTEAIGQDASCLTDCQCDLCAEERDLEAITIAVLLLMAEDKTDSVIPITNNQHAATGQPEAKAGDVGTIEGSHLEPLRGCPSRQEKHVPGEIVTIL